jgi:hypothetical protein
VNFEEYLISKRIDSTAFQQAEPSLYKEWEEAFGQMHPNSFTVQKLNLINPIRRKYHLKVVPPPVVKNSAQEKNENTPSAEGQSPTAVKPAVPRHVFKPKPKIN